MFIFVILAVIGFLINCIFPHVSALRSISTCLSVIAIIGSLVILLGVIRP